MDDADVTIDNIIETLRQIKEGRQGMVMLAGILDNGRDGTAILGQAITCVAVIADSHFRKTCSAAAAELALQEFHNFVNALANPDNDTDAQPQTSNAKARLH